MDQKKRGMLRYIVELTGRDVWEPTLATATSYSSLVENGVISVFQTGRPDYVTYWDQWGGRYSTPAQSRVQVFFKQFLSEVSSLEELLLSENSYWVNGDEVYTHTEYYPWQYSQAVASVRESFGFSSAPRDYLDPSDDRYSGVRYPALLKIPTGMTQKLADPINGVIPTPTFSIDILNGDGDYDNGVAFNTPVILKKSSVENAEISDFTVIRTGIVDNQSMTTGMFKISAAETLRSLSQPVCDVITSSQYPNATGSVGKNMPVAWGSITGAPLIEVGDLMYIVCDPSYLQEIVFVYDSDGNSVVFVEDNGVITTAETVTTCDFIGKSDNTVGSIVVSEVSSKAGFAYVDGVWDVSEVDEYIKSSAKVDYLFSGGSVEKLVKEITASDTSFFFSKSSGELSMRRWGQKYETHTIDSWLITKFVGKTFSDPKYFSSSVQVDWGYDWSSKESLYSYTDESIEDSVIEEYSKKKRTIFPTFISNENDAVSLASRLLSRHSVRSEVVTVHEGFDTTHINMLDTVIQPIVVTDSLSGISRRYSEYTMWVVVGVSQAQDVLILEQLSRERLFSGVIYQPSSDTRSGVMYQPSIENSSGLLYQPSGVSKG